MSWEDLMFIIYILTNLLIFLLLFSLQSQIRNLNHNLYFVFKANNMLWDISEDAILFTKLDKDATNSNKMSLL